VASENVLTEDEASTCFIQALTRIALVLNQSSVGGLFERLRSSDEDLMQEVSLAPYRDALFRLSVGNTDRELAYDDYANFFYGTMSVRESIDHPGIRTVVHDARPAFFALFRQEHHDPDYAPEDLGLDVRRDNRRLLGTNYLTKNLWHNVVHVERQRINDSNFRFFSGVARDYSDFMADNLAGIMLAVSYGLDVRADSLEERPPFALPIIHALRRNRCNRMFASRAKERRKREGRESAQELDWNYRRWIAVYVSGWLLAAGRAVATISVEFGRKLPGFDRGIVVEVNGVYCWTGFPRTAIPAENSTPEERRAFRTHIHRIAVDVDKQYRAALAEDTRRQVYARDALAAQLRCLGVIPPPGLVAALNVLN